MRLQDAVRRKAAEQALRFRTGGAPAVQWALRLTGAATASWVVASSLFPDTVPLLAPLTALLVVQVTPVSLLASGLDRVVSVVAGVSLAVAFSAVAPLAWWSLGILIAVSIMIGQALRLRSNLIEVAISAMLVLGVGSLGAGSAAWQRITETLVGAAVGIAVNLLLPPEVGSSDAGRAIRGLGDGLAVLLERAADDLTSGAPLADRAPGWLDDARRVTHDMPQVGAALLRAEQGRRLNVRAIGTPDVGPSLRQGLEALEHSAVAVRGVFRSLDDAARSPDWQREESADDVRRGLAQVLGDTADAVRAFGRLVQAEAEPEHTGALAELARVEHALEELREDRARLSDLLTVAEDPAVTELHAALLTSVRRLLAELDLQDRVRRQLRLQRPARQVLPRPRSPRRRRP